ncbi:hypothetical protein M3Y95_01106700 [Aphelenchoides besseyi]|nr:hypothetical protein M3Y95_01106700 [Aphelenchoides besseyi]
MSVYASTLLLLLVFLNAEAQPYQKLYAGLGTELKNNVAQEETKFENMKKKDVEKVQTLNPEAQDLYSSIKQVMDEILFTVKQEHEKVPDLVKPGNQFAVDAHIHLGPAPEQHQPFYQPKQEQPPHGQQPFPQPGQEQPSSLPEQHQPFYQPGQQLFPQPGPFPAPGQQPFPQPGQQPFPQPGPFSQPGPFPQPGQQPFPQPGQQPFSASGQEHPTYYQQPPYNQW